MIATGSASRATLIAGATIADLKRMRMAMITDSAQVRTAIEKAEKAGWLSFKEEDHPVYNFR